MVRHLVTSATDPVFGDILFCWGVKKEDTSPTEDSIYLDFSMLHFRIPLFLYDTCFSTGILSHFYRHDLAYLSNVNVLYRPGFEADGCCCSCIHSFVFSGKGSEDRTCVFFVIYGNKRCFESFHNCTSHRRVKCETFKSTTSDLIS